MFVIGSTLSLTAGLLFGSFMMVLIPRIYKQHSGIILGRSKCSHCHHQLKATDLIPLVSYLLLKGKCRYCQTKISAIYPIVEIVTALSFFTVFSYFGPVFLNTPTAASILIFTLVIIHIFVLLFTFFYDLLYYEISDAILIPAIVIAFLQTFIGTQIFPVTGDALIGAAIPVSIFLIQILISSGKWLGLGDLRIGAYMGLLLGTYKTILALLITYMLGALVAIILLVTKKATKKTPIPFGPFLTIGTMVALFLGDIILNWYFHKLLLLM